MDFELDFELEHGVFELELELELRSLPRCPALGLLDAPTCSTSMFSSIYFSCLAGPHPRLLDTETEGEPFLSLLPA